MKKSIAILILTAAFGALASTGVDLEKAKVDLSDQASLQRGAGYYVDYCLGCHSLKYMRYSRIGEDLNLPEETVKADLMYTGTKIFDPMTIAMQTKDAAVWFGIEAPDLSLIARSRGADWVYAYLRSFYRDDARPLGVNNLLYPDVAMPHALWELQGLQAAVFKQEKPKGEVFDRFIVVEKGRMTPEEFDRAVDDLVNFLAYVSEPAQLERTRLGKYVIFFLVLFGGIAYLLKREYWKDVH